MYRVLLVEDEEIELETLRDYIDWKKKNQLQRNSYVFYLPQYEHEGNLPR